MRQLLKCCRGGRRRGRASRANPWMKPWPVGMLPGFLSSWEFVPCVLSPDPKSALFGSRQLPSRKTQPLQQLSAVTWCRRRGCSAGAGEDWESGMPDQISTAEMCKSTSREEEEGTLDPCCTPAGRDLTCRLPPQLYLGPKYLIYSGQTPTVHSEEFCQSKYSRSRPWPHFLLL